MYLKRSMKKSKKNKFNPVQIGLKRQVMGYKSVVYNLIRDGELIGWLSYHDFLNPPEWLVYKKLYDDDVTGAQGGLVYQGAIPSNSFGKQLIKNLFHTT